MPFALTAQYIPASAPVRVRFLVNPGELGADRIDSQAAGWHEFRLAMPQIRNAMKR
jgi:hypothetical protein